MSNKIAYTKKHWGKTHVYKDPFATVPTYPGMQKNTKPIKIPIKIETPQPAERPQTLPERPSEVTRRVDPNERKCANCNDPVGAYPNTVDGKTYCEDCYSEYFFVCADCGESEDIDEANPYKNEWYCNRCYAKIPQCRKCGGKTNEDNLIYVEDYGQYCEDCYQDNFGSCEQCGDTLPYTEFRNIRPLNKKYEESLCEHCYKEALIEKRRAIKERAHADKTCGKCGLEAPVIDRRDQPTNLMFKNEDSKTGYLCPKCTQEEEGQEILFRDKWSKTARLADIYFVKLV